MFLGHSSAPFSVYTKFDSIYFALKKWDNNEENFNTEREKSERNVDIGGIEHLDVEVEDTRE